MLPGTLNGQCVLPTVTQLSSSSAWSTWIPHPHQHDGGGAAGAAWGAAVASFDRQTIRLVMAVSLLVVAGLIFAGLLGFSPRWRGHGAEWLQAGIALPATSCSEP